MVSPFFQHKSDFEDEDKLKPSLGLISFFLGFNLHVIIYQICKIGKE